MWHLNCVLQFPPDDAVRCWEDHHVTALAAIGSPLKEYGQVGPTVKSGQLRGGKVRYTGLGC